MSISDGFPVQMHPFVYKSIPVRSTRIEKLVIAVKIKEPEAPILSSTYSIELDTVLSNTYTITVRGK